MIWSKELDTRRNVVSLADDSALHIKQPRNMQQKVQGNESELLAPQAEVSREQCLIITARSSTFTKREEREVDQQPVDRK